MIKFYTMYYILLSYEFLAAKLYYKDIEDNDFLYAIHYKLFMYTFKLARLVSKEHLLSTYQDDLTMYEGVIWK